jgi:hypothetical protein
LSDGTTGWVKSAYLTSQVPAVVRVKALEEELDRSRATTPALAEAAARSEVEQLKRELKAKEAELVAANAAPPATGSTNSAPQSGTLAGISAASPRHSWIGVASTSGALIIGFWLGYATLARRVKHKFGGIKVY